MANGTTSGASPDLRCRDYHFPPRNKRVTHLAFVAVALCESRWKGQQLRALLQKETTAYIIAHWKEKDCLCERAVWRLSGNTASTSVIGGLGRKETNWESRLARHEHSGETLGESELGIQVYDQPQLVSLQSRGDWRKLPLMIYTWLFSNKDGVIWDID